MLCSLVSLASVVASEGKAAEKTGSAAATAKACFKRGRTHYQLGEYREALKEFKEAYRLKPDASFLYNIAQCHRQLGDLADAIKFYGNYLREAPDAANRNEVERQIRELKAAAERQQQQEQASASARIAGADISASVCGDTVGHRASAASDDSGPGACSTACTSR